VRLDPRNCRFSSPPLSTVTETLSCLSSLTFRRATVVDAEGRDEIIVPPLPSNPAGLSSWSLTEKQKAPSPDPWAWLHDRKTGISDEMLEQRMGSISFVLDSDAVAEPPSLHDEPLTREVGIVASTVKVSFILLGRLTFA
jgi:hypothetical protein